MHGMAGPVGGGPCVSRSRPALEPTGNDRAGGPDIRLPSAGPSWSVLTTSNPYVPTRSFLSGSARSLDETGLPQFLHSATSQPCPRQHTGFDPGYDPVKREFYGGSIGDSGVKAPEPGIPLWRRGMGNPPQPCYAKHCIAMHGIAMQCNRSAVPVLSRRVPPRPRSPPMAWRAATLARSMRRTCRKASSASVYISVDMGATVQLQGNSTWATRVLRGNLG
jgi:hypothetical protein